MYMYMYRHVHCTVYMHVLAGRISLNNLLLTTAGQITRVRLGFIHTPSYVSPPVFTLNCTNHGPATTVTWTRNSVMIQEDANHRMTKTILHTKNSVTYMYENTLTVTGWEAGVYQCTVRSNRPTENRNSSNNFTVEGTATIHNINTNSLTHTCTCTCQST